MGYSERLESLIQWGKRLERRYLFSEYEDNYQRSQWARSSRPTCELLELPLDPQAEKWNRLLIFKPDDIGDAVYALPALRLLKDRFPNLHLSLICQNKTRPLYERTQLFDAIASSDAFNRIRRFPRINIKSCLSQLPKGKFDAAVFLRSYPGYFGQFLKVPADRHIHPRDPRMRSKSPFQQNISLWGPHRAHQAIQMSEILSLATQKVLNQTDIRFPNFVWKPEDMEALNLVNASKYVVVHPFAPAETRQYPMSHWKSILSAVSKKFNLPIVVIGSKSDPKIEGDHLIQLQGKLRLGQSGYLISKSQFFLGNESGPLHWAAAMGVPTVAFWGGHSAITEWGPIGRALAVTVKVSCSPCHRKVCPGYGTRCLTDLQPDRVLPQIFEFLQRNSKEDLETRRASFQPQPTL